MADWTWSSPRSTDPRQPHLTEPDAQIIDDDTSAAYRTPRLVDARLIRFACLEENVLKVPYSLLLAAKPQVNVAELDQAFGFAACVIQFLEQS